MSDRPKSRFKAERESARPAALQGGAPPGGGGLQQHAAAGAAAPPPPAAAPRPASRPPDVGPRGADAPLATTTLPPTKTPVQLAAGSSQTAAPPTQTGAEKGGSEGMLQPGAAARGAVGAGVQGGGQLPPGTRGEAGGTSCGGDPGGQRRQQGQGQGQGATLGGVRAGESVQDKIARYEKFIDETLRIKLLQVQAARVGLVTEMEAYERLGTTLKTVRDEQMSTLRTSVNVGCDLYMQAMVPDTSRVMIDIGLGFYAEMTVDEGIAFVEKRVGILQEGVDGKSHESAEISAQIDVVLQGINELMQA